MGDLKNLDHLRGRIADIIEWKNLTVAGGYGHEPIDVDEIMAWLEKYGKPLPTMCATRPCTSPMR